MQRFMSPSSVPFQGRVDVPQNCLLSHETVSLAILLYILQKREAKACLEAAGHMLKMHAGGRIPLNRKDDEIYKVGAMAESDAQKPWVQI